MGRRRLVILAALRVVACTGELLPASFRVVPAVEDRATVHEMEDRFAALPGVTRANSAVAMLESVQNVLDSLGGCA